MKSITNYIILFFILIVLGILHKKFEEKRNTIVNEYQRIKIYLDNLIKTKQIDPKDGFLRDLTKDEMKGKQ